MTQTQKQQQQKKRQQQQALQDSFEQAPEKKKRKPLESRAERAVINFTRLPEKALETLLTPQNHTSLKDPKLQEKMRHSQEEQKETAKKIRAVRDRLQQLRQEESEAHQYFEEKKKLKEQEEAEEERRKAEEEEKKKKAAQEEEEPSTKQKRGMFGMRKKPKKTSENKPGQGKQ